MTNTLEQIKERLAELSASEHAELANYLLRLLDDGDEPDADAAWLTEAERRMAHAKSGAVAGVPADEVFAKTRKKQL